MRLNAGSLKTQTLLESVLATEQRSARSAVDALGTRHRKVSDEVPDKQSLIATEKGSPVLVVHFRPRQGNQSLGPEMSALAAAEGVTSDRSQRFPKSPAAIRSLAGVFANTMPRSSRKARSLIDHRSTSFGQPISHAVDRPPVQLIHLSRSERSACFLRSTASASTKALLLDFTNGLNCAAIKRTS